MGGGGNKNNKRGVKGVSTLYSEVIYISLKGIKYLLNNMSVTCKITLLKMERDLVLFESAFFGLCMPRFLHSSLYICPLIIEGVKDVMYI